jgi:hypothetical protein
MKVLVLVLCSLVFVNYASGQENAAVQSKYSADGLLGIHNSAGGGGVGFGYSVSERLSVGIRWFAGRSDETKTYDNYDSTRISFTSAEGYSEEFSLNAKYLVWDTLTISTGIGQRKYSSVLDIRDKQNFFRAGEVRTDSTMTDIYIGIGNYWSGSWYRIGADWIGFSVPLSSKVDAVYSYNEPTASGIKFNESNPQYYYNNVVSLLKRSKTVATQTSYTFLLGNLSVYF